MSDTPRTNDQIGYAGSTMSVIRIEFCRQLERELNAANQRIKRLEEALDAAIHYCEFHGPVGATPNTTKLLLKNLREAKENKPQT